MFISLDSASTTKQPNTHTHTHTLECKVFAQCVLWSPFSRLWWLQLVAAAAAVVAAFPRFLSTLAFHTRKTRETRPETREAAAAAEAHRDTLQPTWHCLTRRTGSREEAWWTNAAPALLTGNTVAHCVCILFLDRFWTVESWPAIRRRMDTEAALTELSTALAAAAADTHTLLRGHEWEKARIQWR